MNFRIIRLGAMTRRDVIKNIIKWVLLFLILIILYSIEATLPFIKWQPYLCVTLACGVAIYETEMASFIFASCASLPSIAVFLLQLHGARDMKNTPD